MTSEQPPTAGCATVSCLAALPRNHQNRHLQPGGAWVERGARSNSVVPSAVCQAVVSELPICDSEQVEHNSLYKLLRI